ncbi:hypothetical protein EPUS_05280 [Endocarpon pusillum Z07020]|uniref:Uncharacterized protein n=1 Tax=Endocarpon pusillum (strain Z07020 / HMAS-L-300199) TaxID=1263415 RepID=U1HH86_ENDPU|nr:uncharacterized protein EPUS_05280 [Endocarpon pusillum Z07020]ERF68199.1 hypothetical protein EPUS_05280 [Endocarpon pusillum Z07020]
MVARWHFPQIPTLRLPRSTTMPANLFQMFYTPVFAPWRWDREHLTPNDILYPKLMDSYQNMPKDILRWHVVANTAVKEVPKAVMRERLRRRLREAFRDALKQLGYDWHGRVLQPGQATGQPLNDLKGTWEIHCRGRAGLDCEFLELVNYAKSAVSAVDKSCKQHAGIVRKVGREAQWWEGVSA